MARAYMTRTASIPMDADTLRRLEALRGRGAAKAPFAAVVRAAISEGLPALERGQGTAEPGQHSDPDPSDG